MNLFGDHDLFCQWPCRPSRSIRAQARKRERPFDPDRVSWRKQDYKT